MHGHGLSVSVIFLDWVKEHYIFSSSSVILGHRYTIRDIVWLENKKKKSPGRLFIMELKRIESSTRLAGLAHGWSQQRSP